MIIVEIMLNKYNLNLNKSIKRYDSLDTQVLPSERYYEYYKEAFFLREIKTPINEVYNFDSLFPKVIII